MVTRGKTRKFVKIRKNSSKWVEIMSNYLYNITCSSINWLNFPLIDMRHSISSEWCPIIDSKSSIHWKKYVQMLTSNIWNKIDTMTKVSQMSSSTSNEIGNRTGVCVSIGSLYPQKMAIVVVFSMKTAPMVDEKSSRRNLLTHQQYQVGRPNIPSMEHQS